MNEKTKELINNRKAFFNYEIIETFETGISLTGTEIKSLRDHGGSLQEAYVKIIKNELWLIGSHISPYKYGNIHNHEERRDRKLLMHTKEILHLKEATQEKGFAIVPISMYLKKGWVKVKIGLGKGKKKEDKRETIKEREDKRRMQQALKRHG